MVVGLVMVMGLLVVVVVGGDGGGDGAAGGGGDGIAAAFDLGTFLNSLYSACILLYVWPWSSCSWCVLVRNLEMIIHYFLFLLKKDLFFSYAYVCVVSANVTAAA